MYQSREKALMFENLAHRWRSLADEHHQLTRTFEARKIADLGKHRIRGDQVHAAHGRRASTIDAGGHSESFAQPR